MSTASSVEHRLLKFSILMGVVYSVIGITWGLILHRALFYLMRSILVLQFYYQ